MKISTMVENFLLCTSGPKRPVVELDTFVTNYGLNLERKYVFLSEHGRGSMLILDDRSVFNRGHFDEMNRNDDSSVEKYFVLIYNINFCIITNQMFDILSQIAFAKVNFFTV